MSTRRKALEGLIVTAVGIIGISVLSFLTTPSKPIQAAPPLPTMPPRATPTSTPSQDATKRRDEKPIGAYIMLQVQSPQSGLWTIIQWQDNAGTWHDVEGWQGTLDQGNTKVWWVADTDFGKGPFRWVIYQGQDGPRLATSTPFNLPSEANQTIQIRVSSGL